MTTATGKTLIGNTQWQPYPGVPNAIFVDVDTSSAGFTTVPNYITSLGGTVQHWSTVGVTSIYNPTATSFRVYIRFADFSALTPAAANTNGWHVVWVGVTP